MATLVQVVNIALEAMGEPLDQAITVGTTGGDLAVRVPEIAREFLEEYPYSFSGSRVELLKIPGKPIGFEHAYALPAGFLNLHCLSRTGGADSWEKELRYVIEDGALLADYNPLFAIYTRDAYVSEYGRWPALFANAVGLEAAYRRNRHVTQGAGEGSRLEDRARLAWRKVRNWDARLRPWTQKPVGRFVSARTSSRYGSYQG